MCAELLPVCHQCGQVPPEGLYDGFRLKGVFFCSDCWNKVSNSDIEAEEYQFMVGNIKNILFQGKTRLILPRTANKKNLSDDYPF